MFSIQQISNVCVDFFNASLRKILVQELSLAQLSQNLDQLVNQIGVAIMTTLLEQADAAIYAAIRPNH